MTSSLVVLAFHHGIGQWTLSITSIKMEKPSRTEIKPCRHQSTSSSRFTRHRGRKRAMTLQIREMSSRNFLTMFAFWYCETSSHLTSRHWDPGPSALIDSSGTKTAGSPRTLLPSTISWLLSTLILPSRLTFTLRSSPLSCQSILSTLRFLRLLPRSSTLLLLHGSTNTALS